MEFQKITQEIKKINFNSLRTDCDNFFEAVIVKEELNKLTDKLKQFFGAPAFPSKNRLSYSAQELVNGFGGLGPGQSLYLSGEQDALIFAMLWPWKDGVRTTVKIIQK
ncbi:MAG: hypothetical protein ABIG46_07665 [Candidatus Omnitrophota bacterium]|nr:hypothetical protein [Candidatus Omnitrophota bacterium]